MQYIPLCLLVLKYDIINLKEWTWHHYGLKNKINLLNLVLIIITTLQ